MQEICASTAPVLAAPAAGGKEQLVGPEMAAAAEAMAQSTNAVLRIFVAITAINEPGRAPADAGFKLLAGSRTKFCRAGFVIITHQPG